MSNPQAVMAPETDHVALLMDRVESSADANAKALSSTMLSPRFYTATTCPWPLASNPCFPQSVKRLTLLLLRLAQVVGIKFAMEPTRFRCTPLN
jgi:hypothetical protein